jgi:carbonic anhydrase
MSASKRINGLGDRCCCSAASGPHHRREIELSRRYVLRAGLVGSATSFLGGIGVNITLSHSAAAQGANTPDATLSELLDGNARYVEDRLVSPERDLSLIRQKTTEKQQPFAAVLSCADSRVPVEWLFDQTIGDIFVTRVAGNIATPEILASLEYGAQVLGTKVILVLGHANCGAVKAAIDVTAAPGQISALYAHIRPAIDQAGSSLDAVIRANAKLQARLLREASPALSQLVKQNQLKVASAYYDLATGKVTLLD